MNDIIHIKDKAYFAATSNRADRRTMSLKDDDTFAVFSRHGEVLCYSNSEHGLYHKGMRHLCGWEVTINQQHPTLLHSTTKVDNSYIVLDQCNATPLSKHSSPLQREELHLFRSLQLTSEGMQEHVRLTNFSSTPIEFQLHYRFEADFVDIFEVRGHRREQRGILLPATVKDGRVTLAYRGLDKLCRQTQIEFDPIPKVLAQDSASYTIKLEPGQSDHLYIQVNCQSEDTTAVNAGRTPEHLTVAPESVSGSMTTIYSDNEQFNSWLYRSRADLTMLTTNTPYGPYPYAGVPWFSTPFGRDALITALQTLWINPSLAAGVLRFLAVTQATKTDPQAEAEPGKIIHEIRDGEMANLGEIPFKRYYGTIDATPLFIMLAGRYYYTTGDKALIESIWPNILAALTWIDQHGDLDNDGFVEYINHNHKGLTHQGWKDSNDSIFHADGSEPQGPIALCEVQAYVYDAKRIASHLAASLGHQRLSAQLENEAYLLKERFNQRFWCEELSTYAIALDGNKQACEVINSNVGHALYCGIVQTNKARRVANTLLHPDSFNGWGIRTISRHQSRYNPMSYHNGSIWPHDSALAAAGLARYGLKTSAMTLFKGLFDAACFMDQHRLPELFCGFERQADQGPTLYPVACSPQAWASGTVYMLLQALLGISYSAEKQTLYFHKPRLPNGVNRLNINNLCVGEACVDLSLHRYDKNVGIDIENKTGPLQIKVEI